MAAASSSSSHYEAHSADSYEEAFFYEPGPYMEHLVTLVGNRLQLQLAADADADDQQHHEHEHNNKEVHTSSRVILDIGGGTGNFSQALIDNDGHSNSNHSQFQCIVVEPYLDPTSISNSTSNNINHPAPNENEDNNGSSSSSSSSRIKFVKESAEAFLKPRSSSSNNMNNNDWWRKNYNQVLFKEIIHHIKSSKTRVDIFRGINDEINTINASPSSSLECPCPSILIITRPQIDIDYPLWNEAKQVWKENQPSSTQLCSELEAAGFVDMKTTIEVYPCKIPLMRWIAMVKQRCWSTFSEFSDDQLERACEVITKDCVVDGDGVLRFEDRLVFISARKV